jgi:ABC-type sugar transport system ATPase subunit
MTALTQSPVVEIREISKRYGAVQALRGVSMAVRKGTIHAVLGENGAGKSTLIEIMAGNVLPDTGTIHICGVQVGTPERTAVQRKMVAVVHQHLSLAPNVTVAENLFPGALIGSRGFVHWPTLFRRAQASLDRYKVPVKADEQTGKLSLAVQQQVEIARALSTDAEVIALDEPTSSLSIVESQALLHRLADLRAEGCTIIIITHYVADALVLADDVTVLRDGQLVGSYPTASLTETEIVRMMIGREVSSLYPTRKGAKRLPGSGLDATDVVSGDRVRGVSLRVQAGEVVGLYGLVGAGRTELLQTLFGLRSRQSGTIKVADGALPARHNVQTAIRAGLALLPEDRTADGLFLGRSIAENITILRLGELAPWFIVEALLEAAAEPHIHEFEIKGISRTTVQNLSGGNQQKVLFARWLSMSPRVLMADEPTRGVDVGTKARIHLALRALSDKGGGVLVASSEIPEVLGLSDRIYVMAAGRIVDEMTAAEANAGRLLESASQLSTRRAGGIA